MEKKEQYMCTIVLLLTSAARDQGPNIPPSPVSGSNMGMTPSRKTDDMGAWQHNSGRWGWVLEEFENSFPNLCWSTGQ